MSNDPIGYELKLPYETYDYDFRKTEDETGITVETWCKPKPDFEQWCEYNLSWPYSFELKGWFPTVIGHEDDLVLIRMRY